MKKTFLICPVRGHDMQETEDIVKKLESEGWKVHWPPRDTNQEDEHGYNICTENMNAIKYADVVHIVWDGKSTGSVFDMGMAFALGKKIVPISMPPLTEYKSFQNMVHVWANLD